MSNQFFGKYRGTVVNNLDPEMRGRLLLMVPDVLNLIPSTWAEPCLALAGPIGLAMGVYMVPPIGTGVWVEFEQGNPNRPVWVGCRWGSQAQVPSQAHMGLPVSPNIVIQTSLQNVFVISDLPGPTGGLMLKSTTGASITVNDTGIYIDNGKGASIKLIGPAITIDGSMVAINGTALVIT